MNIVFTLIVVFLFSFPAHANEQTASVERYLNNIENFTADFRQVDTEGNVASGKFYLQKPGKFRWEYDDSQPLLILSNGKRLIYVDKELQEVTYIGVEDTLAGFLARDEIKFEGDIKLLEYNKSSGLIRVKVTQTEKPEEGNLVLGFTVDEKTQQPKQLVGLEVQDQNGASTLVSFANADYKTKIDDEKFIFRDPKFHKDAWQ